jgi:hypothetical protein
MTQSKKDGHSVDDVQLIAVQCPSLPQLSPVGQPFVAHDCTHALGPWQGQLATSQTRPLVHSLSVVQPIWQMPQPGACPGATQMPVVQSLLERQPQLLLHTGAGSFGPVQPENVCTPLQPTQ